MIPYRDSCHSDDVPSVSAWVLLFNPFTDSRLKVRIERRLKDRETFTTVEEIMLDTREKLGEGIWIYSILRIGKSD